MAARMITSQRRRRFGAVALTRAPERTTAPVDDSERGEIHPEADDEGWTEFWESRSISSWSCS